MTKPVFTVTGAQAGYAVCSAPDKPVRTPLGAALLLPSHALAERIAEELQGWKHTNPPPALTRIAFTALDLTPERRTALMEELLSWLDTDLLRYRAEPDTTIGQTQTDQWDPLILWAEKQFGITLPVTQGILPVPVSDATRGAMLAYLSACCPFMLSALFVATNASGSLLLALALLKKSADAENVIALSRLEEDAQARCYGADSEQEAMLAVRAADIYAACKLLAHLT